MGESIEPLDRLLNLKQVRDVTSLGASTIYRRMKEGTFPLPLDAGGGMTRWLESSIQGWIRSLSHHKPDGRHSLTRKSA